MTPPGVPTLDFTLPEHLEAHEPPEVRGVGRDGVRLLVSSLNSDRIVHARFRDLPAFLRPGDLVVVNVSATLPAALTARRSDGSDVALHISTHLPAELVVVEFRQPGVSPGGTLTLHGGEAFGLPGGGIALALVPYPRSKRLWVARLDLPEPLLSYLQRWGRPIAYPYVRGTWPIEMYQTVYASAPGSAEMPSAGRPFTPEILDRLTLAGVQVASILLHAGVASLEADEPLYEEYFEVPDETAVTVRRTRSDGGRVIAVGTTVVRALESALDAAGRPIASRGWTDLVITPPRGLTVVDGLLTGFHEPKAAHLALLEAIVGRPHLERAYRTALETGYLWHEFGDVHLIVPE
ncbi:MAG TPA: S-adenosylmethionine:tRNA ribosyltransferase-isomerase [bacterium]|jgi:S-adenosylmethionine:tRNA ribosyltransferase-isomerase|nr:S-adenosylmethionine:tRNA ribosyltransferase-isomerase [bacterium]